jgi:hypothetical protein
MKKTTLWMSVVVLLVVVSSVGWVALTGWLVERDFVLYESSKVTTGYRVRFGTIETDASGNDFLGKATTTIPLRLKETGFRYGIEIVPPDDGPYTYHCVFHFSAAPKIVTGDLAGQTPSATLQTNEVSVSGGKTLDENWFDPGDPVGEQSMDVFVNGRLVKTITYTVVPDN